MCTAATYKTKDHYFGRTLDYEFSYKETVTITPRNFEFRFTNGIEMKNHYALIGMAYVVDDYPLYYDATNEHGLSIAGLNFPDNAYYGQACDDKDNISPYEFIPWILAQCKNISDARKLIDRLCLVNIDFSDELRLSPLHWIISDRDESIVVEPMIDGIKVHDNPVGVLTNNPPFDFHMHNLAGYMGLSREQVVNRISEKVELKPYSRGMGAMGLPGDLSSASRFIKVAFTKLNSISSEEEEASVSQFFHILSSVAQHRGLVHLGEGQYEISIYTSCCNTEKGIYYYRTYDSHRIKAVDMHRENLEGHQLVSYKLQKEADFYYHN